MNRLFKLTSVLSAVAGLSLLAPAAHALTTTQTDNLESDAGWSFWATNPSLSFRQNLSWANARSPYRIEFIGWSPATASDWLQFHRTFTTNVTPISCSASVYLRGTGIGFGTGSVDMINPATWTYIGTTSYSNVPANAWTKITVNNQWACSKSIVLRIVLTGAAGQYRQIYADDASVTWTY